MYNNILSDEDALKKANSQSWVSTQPKSKMFKHAKNSASIESSRVDLSCISFEELTQKYAESQIILHEYSKMPKDIQLLLKDEISRAAKFHVAVKINLKKIESPEKKLFFDDFEELKKNHTKLKNELNGKIKILENQLAQAKEINPSKKDYLKKLHNIEKSSQREIAIHIAFKKIIRERIGEQTFFPMIREATITAEESLKLNEVIPSV